MARKKKGSISLKKGGTLDNVVPESALNKKNHGKGGQFIELGGGIRVSASQHKGEAP